MQAVQVLAGMLAGTHLSAMGRGLAGTSYVLSKALYHAEHEGLHPQVAAILSSNLARTIDRPTRVPGVPSSLLPGSPAVGGFGMLPLSQHITARHLKWACRLLRHLVPAPPQPSQPAGQIQQGMVTQPRLAQQPAWVTAASTILRQVCPGLHPAQTLLLAFQSEADHISQGFLTGVPLQRMLIPQGPLLRMAQALQTMGGIHFHPQAHNAPPDLPLLWLQLQGIPDAALAVGIHALVWGSQLEAGIQDAMGPARPATVRALTALQMTAQDVARRAAHAAYARQALADSGLTADVQQQRCTSFIAGFPRLWRMPWDNQFKEVLWRLAVNGVQGAGGHGICHRGQCVCGYQLTQAQIRSKQSTLHRQHAFWDCPVAQAVRQQLQRGLPAGRQLAQWHVWLLQPPPASGVRPVVWRVVCIAALWAMEQGRRYLWWAQSEQQAHAMQRAIARACSCFWYALLDFSRDRRVATAPGWAAVGPRHPFLAVHITPPLTARVVVHHP